MRWRLTVGSSSARVGMPSSSSSSRVTKRSPRRQTRNARWARYPWPALAPLKVRMALHTGEAQVIDDDYVGVALHVVARLCGAGHGGQVLLSDTTHALTNDVSTLALGIHRLRDVPAPMHIYQLCGEGLGQDHPPLRTVSGSANNLPVARDALIGRELDLVEVAEALQEHRLVTLVGSGGAGKTRLALEVAAALLGREAGRVVVRSARTRHGTGPDRGVDGRGAAHQRARPRASGQDAP